jgi:thiamine-monophosphate kinase
VVRGGAQPGDRIVVSGTIGDAALGLAIITDMVTVGDAVVRETLLGRYRIPQPRVGLAKAVLTCAHAAMDVSDGLAGDLAKLCAASGVSAVIDAASVPLSEAARGLMSEGKTNIETMLSGGDDYEILCAIADDRLEAFVQAASGAGIAVTPIGTVVAGRTAPKWLDANGQEIALRRLSYSHF